MMMVGDRLELRGGEKAERGVPAAAVEEDLDVLEDLGAQFGLGWPAAAVDELLLQRREEALGDGVVVAVAAAAHRLGDAGGAGLLGEGQRDELPGLKVSSQHRVIGERTVAVRAERRGAVVLSRAYRRGGSPVGRAV